MTGNSGRWWLRFSAANESPWPDDLLEHMRVEARARRKRHQKVVRPLRRRAALRGEAAS